jgi:hypothetical protein
MIKLLSGGNNIPFPKGFPSYILVVVDLKFQLQPLQLASSAQNPSNSFLLLFFMLES